VDVLQFVMWLREERQLPRIALMISAWDLVTAPLSPPEWLERRLPLLSQFLMASVRDRELRVYGISAQGGDLQRDRAALQLARNASERIRVIEGRKEHHDLSAPIKWLLFQT
jgi:hypothetical protein